jgi:hypothetical protein
MSDWDGQLPAYKNMGVLSINTWLWTDHIMYCFVVISILT